MAFQFLIGRLATHQPPVDPIQLVLFQFLIGRLATVKNG